MADTHLASDKTHLRCKIIIEVLGKPKKHVEDALAKYIEEIKEDSDLVILNQEIAPVTEKDEFWSTFADLEMIVKGIPKLIAFCFQYMPSSISIIKPEHYSMGKATIEDFVNNLQARLHEVDMIVKQQKNENQFLRQNMQTAVKNSILIALSFQKLKKKHLEKITGIQNEELDSMLDILLKDNKVTLEADTYGINPDANKHAKKQN